MNGSYSDKFNVWGIGLLLTNWLISVGAVVVILFSAQFISKVFLPAVVLASAARILAARGRWP